MGGRAGSPEVRVHEGLGLANRPLLHLPGSSHNIRRLKFSFQTENDLFRVRVTDFKFSEERTRFYIAGPFCARAPAQAQHCVLAITAVRHGRGSQHRRFAGQPITLRPRCCWTSVGTTSLSASGRSAYSCSDVLRLKTILPRGHAGDVQEHLLRPHSFPTRRYWR
jgi:hypothetical protein